VAHHDSANEIYDNTAIQLSGFLKIILISARHHLHNFSLKELSFVGEYVLHARLEVLRHFI
jgi:hypothetical protein